MLQWLRNFTRSWDEIFPYVIRYAASIVMGMATVALFTRSQFVTQWWYEDTWSLLQAVTLDLLFFTVIALFLRSVVYKQASITLGGLSLGLSVVAAVVTAITGYQMSMNINDSAVAIVAFHIQPVVFMLVRMIIAVISFIITQYVIVLQEKEHDTQLVTLATVPSVTPVQQENVTPVTTVTPVQQENVTTGKPELKLVQPSNYDRVIALHMQQPTLTAPQLSQECKVNVATVRTYLSRYRIKQKQAIQ
jgi:hypothetical protein